MIMFLEKSGCNFTVGYICCCYYTVSTVEHCLLQHTSIFCSSYEVSAHTLVSISLVFVTGYAASSQAALLSVSGWESWELCDRGPLLFQNSAAPQLC